MDSWNDFRTTTDRAAQLRAQMEQSDREVAAGRTVPLADVLAELDECARQIEARRSALKA